MEEFKLPISSWEAPNVLALQVRDKDPIFDDMLGCGLFHNINELRGGQRHEKWLPLKNIKMGRIRLAITVIEDELEKGKKDLSEDQEITKMTETLTPPSSSIAKMTTRMNIWKNTKRLRMRRAHHREIQVNSEDNELKESLSSSPLATHDSSSPIMTRRRRKEKPREGVWEKRTSVKLEVDEVSISSASENVLESEYIQGKDEGESPGEKNMNSNVKNNNSRSSKSVISKKRDDSHGSSLSNDAM
uniref:Uncharacterized protein n=1 Tax=Ananas comosus var. bracteatus TaxID=296719 RepID=A0A6V7QHC0_ANACO|nr:unnamed protein product [Ananas comosus var. bracteatus]